MIIKLIEQKDKKTLFLSKGGQDAPCPYRQPILTPSATIKGSIDITILTCNSACPLFVLDNRNRVHLFCGAAELVYKNVLVEPYQAPVRPLVNGKS